MTADDGCLAQVLNRQPPLDGHAAGCLRLLVGRKPRASRCTGPRDPRDVRIICERVAGQAGQDGNLLGERRAGEGMQGVYPTVATVCLRTSPSMRAMLGMLSNSGLVSSEYFCRLNAGMRCRYAW